MAAKPQILLTNDDGIDSPGLWAAAEGLSELGYVHVVAPRLQSSGAGRSLPSSSDGRIEIRKLTVHGKEWDVHAVGGTPAQAVLHGILEVIEGEPDLVVSGINYGENVGTGITISGTVGAALEAASIGIPAMAISLQTATDYHLTYSTDINFAAARHFATLFGRLLLDQRLPGEVDLIKVDIPENATIETPWAITRLARTRYYRPMRPARASWDEPGLIPYELSVDPLTLPEDSDVYTLLVRKQVSVTPLTLDMTARVDLAQLERLLK
jgi:5'-nucleotidase